VHGGGQRTDGITCYGDSGGASRFFYTAKPSRAERDRGCEHLPARTAGEATDREDGTAGISPRAGAGRTGGARNIHPTVKPAALIRWLVQLVTPPGGVVLDPFAGSGTIFVACEGLDVVVNACERDPEYVQIAIARGLAAP
jgi:site-specific DNA-methyltransferase (adenine-specific)